MKLSIKKILVPTDFSEISLNALAYAATVARTTGAEITLLHVYESYEHNTKLKQAIDFNEIIEKGINDKMEEIKEKDKALWGVKFKSKVVSGKIHNQIEKVAKQLNADLIVMGTHGASRMRNLGKFILGSNAYQTVTSAPCPVITIREPKKNIRFKDIILPLDNSKETKQKVGMAIEWAKMFESTIHIVAVTAFFDELVVQIKDLKALVNETGAMIEKAGVPYTSKMIRHQRISESVTTYAEKINADLIFIVTGQGNRLTDMVIRSAARTVVTDSAVPVLSINIKKK
jgi:nucleotide-binding universal stress UspA family protein